MTSPLLLSPYPHLPTGLQLLSTVYKTTLTPTPRGPKASSLLSLNTSLTLPSTMTLPELSMAAKLVFSHFTGTYLFLSLPIAFADPISPLASPRLSYLFLFI